MAILLTPLLFNKTEGDHPQGRLMSSLKELFLQEASPADRSIESRLQRCVWHLLNWAGRWQLDNALRYSPITKDLRRAFKKKAIKIIEIGSNDYGITPFLKKKIIGIDLSFNKKKIILHGKLTPVIGTAALLPLRASAVDACICVDVLEHIESEGRLAILKEIFMTVIKGGRAYVASPCDPESEVYDRKLQELLIAKKARENVWLRQHIQCGLPGCDELMRMIHLAARQCQRTVAVRAIHNVNRNFWLRYHKILTVNQTVVKVYIQRLLQPFMPLLTLINGGNCYRCLYIIRFVE